jgi:MFS family permease
VKAAVRPVPRLPRNVILLALTSFCADISSEMLYPVLPLFLTRELAAPASIVGVVEGVAEATQYLVQGGSGWLADRLERPKRVALVGYALAALGKPAMGLGTIWPQVLAGRVLDRLGAGIRSAPRDALIASSVEDSRRGAAFGLEGFGDNLGAVIGPLATVALLYAFHVELRWIFFLAFAPGLVAFGLVVPVTETLGSPDDGRQPVRIPIANLTREYWRYLLAVAVFGIGNSSNAFIILQATNIGIPVELTILVYASFNLVAALVSYPAGELSDSWGRKRLFLAGMAVFAVAYMGFGFSGNQVIVAILFVLYGAYQGIARAVGKALATDLAPSDLRATAIGLYASTVGVTALVASGIGGQLWVQIGPTATFLYGAMFAVVGTILFGLLVARR